MKPLNFLRCEDGAIINVAHVQYFDTETEGSYYNGDKLVPATYFVTAYFAPGTHGENKKRISCYSEPRYADTAMDRLWNLLAGALEEETETLVDITPLMPQPSHRAPDPFDSDEGEDRVTHICEQPGNAYCPACEEEAFAQ